MEPTATEAYVSCATDTEVIVAMIVQGDTCSLLWFAPMAGGGPATHGKVAFVMERRLFGVIQLVFDPDADDAVVTRKEINEVIV